MFKGNVGHATITSTRHPHGAPVVVGVHEFKIVPTPVPGTFTVEFIPFLEATSVTVVVNSAATPKVDYNLHLYITACFEHKGLYSDIHLIIYINLL